MSSAKYIGLALSLLATVAYAQTSPGFVQGQPLTASQLNNAFVAKQDYAVLGSAAYRNVGTTAGTVAAGNDPRFATTGASTSAANVFTAIQTVSLNASALPAPLTGTLLNVANADGVISRYQTQSFGIRGAYSCSQYEGTAAAPTVTLAGDTLCDFTAFAYDGTNVTGNLGGFRIIAGTGNISPSNYNSKGCILTTPNGATTAVQGLCQNQAGDVSVGGAATSGAAGSFGAVSIYQNGTQVPTLAASNTWVGQQTLQQTSAGAATIPLTLNNASGTASTEVDLDLNPSTLAANTRSAQIGAVNAGTNAMSLLLKTGNGAPASTRLTVNPNGTYVFNSYSGSAGTLTLDASGNVVNASASTQRTNLGLGTSATVNTGTSGATIPLNNGANTWAATQTFAGDQKTSGTAPTMAGTGCSTPVSGSTDTAGEFQATAGATSCTMSWAASKTNAPFCIVHDRNNTGTPYTYATATNTLVITMSATGATRQMDYYCTQH